MFRDLKRRRRRYLRVGSSIDEDQDDTNMYRCRVCGFICNAEYVEQAGPRPNASEEYIGTVILTDSDGDYYPHVPKGSCGQCGTKYSHHE